MTSSPLSSSLSVQSARSAREIIEQIKEETNLFSRLPFSKIEVQDMNDWGKRGHHWTKLAKGKFGIPVKIRVGSIRKTDEEVWAYLLDNASSGNLPVLLYYACSPDGKEEHTISGDDLLKPATEASLREEFAYLKAAHTLSTTVKHFLLRSGVVPSHRVHNQDAFNKRLRQACKAYDEHVLRNEALLSVPAHAASSTSRDRNGAIMASHNVDTSSRITPEPHLHRVSNTFGSRNENGTLTGAPPPSSISSVELFNQVWMATALDMQQHTDNIEALQTKRTEQEGKKALQLSKIRDFDEKIAAIEKQKEEQKKKVDLAERNMKSLEEELKLEELNKSQAVKKREQAMENLEPNTKALFQIAFNNGQENRKKNSSAESSTHANKRRKVDRSGR